MAFGFSSMMTKAMKVGMEFTMVQIVDQTVNANASIPPLVKTIVGLGTDFAGYEIIDKSLDMLPANMRGMAKTMNKMQATIFAIQQIPNVLSAIQSASSGNFLGTGQ